MQNCFSISSNAVTCCGIASLQKVRMFWISHLKIDGDDINNDDDDDENNDSISQQVNSSLSISSKYSTIKVYPT